ncbi:uncharacterized protein LOC125904311 [Epinephelus fuscoguttatus]|uniref:uncharacterized protein LOC125904311 n=1 Tax=Epinephelus fuscoguttatus TaxID=293821 RepID=UPI0020D0C59B|nr:uncharacterized protein LOC125904311 [Epinephelus fuscoguttatus]
MNAYNTSSDPRVIGGYFVEALETLGKCPKLVRTDHGTENGLVRDLQISLRTTHGDDLSGERSYIAGASTANQRIESWWGILRKEGMEYWIQLLGELQDEGSFDGGVLDKAILQLCVMGLIQEELNNIKDVWNAHRIRPTSNPNVPHGIPNVMYSTPELWDTEDCAMPLDQEELDVSKGQCVLRSCVPCDEDIFDLCMIIVEELGLQFPSKSPLEAIDLYLTLRNAINTELRDG